MDYETCSASLPEGINEKLYELIEKAAHEEKWTNYNELATTIYKEAARTYPSESTKDVLARLGINSGADLVDAISIYMDWRDENPGLGPCCQEKGDMSSGISDIALFLVDNIVTKTKVTNRYNIMSHVCEILEYRFGDGEKLEQKLDQLNLATTKDVLHVIDIYFTMKKLYPDTVFGRKRMYGVWAPAFEACLPKSDDNRSEKEAS